jgi:hypothetical protein
LYYILGIACKNVVKTANESDTFDPKANKVMDSLNK